MTKQEKELVKVISEKMERKKLNGDPKESYKIIKHSTNNFVAEAKVGNEFFMAKGKDSKSAVKNLIKEIK